MPIGPQHAGTVSDTGPKVSLNYSSTGASAAVQPPDADPPAIGRNPLGERLVAFQAIHDPEDVG